MALNKIFDDLLSDIHRDVRGNASLDLLEVPHYAINASRQAFFIKFGAKAGFQNVMVTGLLSTLKRKGDVIGYNKERFGHDMIARMTAGPIVFNMTGLVKVLGLGPRYDYSGDIRSIDMDIPLKYTNYKEGVQTGLRIGLPRIHDMQGFKIKVTGHPLSFPWFSQRVLDAANNVIESIFKLPVSFFVQRVLKDEVEKWRVGDQFKLLFKDTKPVV